MGVIPQIPRLFGKAEWLAGVGFLARDGHFLNQNLHS